MIADADQRLGPMLEAIVNGRPAAAQRSRDAGNPTHPGWHSPTVAAHAPLTVIASIVSVVTVSVVAPCVCLT